MRLMAAGSSFRSAQGAEFGFESGEVVPLDGMGDLQKGVLGSELRLRAPGAKCAFNGNILLLRRVQIKTFSDDFVLLRWVLQAA
jgi:hypothetical protein